MFFFLFTQEACFYVKVNLSFLHGMKAWLHSFLTSTLDIGERSASHLGRFNHRNPLSSSLGGPRRRSENFGEDKNLLLLTGIESWGVQPLAESLHCLRYIESSHIISIVVVWTLNTEHWTLNTEHWTMKADTEWRVRATEFRRPSVGCN